VYCITEGGDVMSYKQISATSLHNYTQQLLEAYDDGYIPQVLSENCPRVLGNGIFSAVLIKKPEEAEVADAQVVKAPRAKKVV
jgi:hypothetical protein